MSQMLWRTDESEKEGMKELVDPSGMMVGYVFEDSVNDVLNGLNLGILRHETMENVQEEYEALVEPMNQHDAGGEA